jgi:hypothetical protein
MNGARPGTLGATRVCPHCKATVLESAAICPGCRHHLRFSSTGTPAEPASGYSALNVEGTIRHLRSADPCEYCIVVDVRDERGEPLARQVISVGLLQPGEARRLNLSVDLIPAKAAAPKAPSAPAVAPQAAAGPSGRSRTP